ncbi:MAG TPA: dihydrofolate reductase family protein [Mycobacteriales bacterium]|jgi:dihydrofolate reductase
MGNVVVTEFVSLDGVFEDPGGAENFEHGGWSFQFDRGADGDRFKLDELNTADAQLLGRVTYEAFAQAWPSITDEVGFAVRMNEMPKSVVSATLTDPTWQNTTVIADNVGGQVRALKDRYAGDILIAGSGLLVRSLMAEDLVDEFHLMVYPIVLGSGRRLFDDGTTTTRLALTDSRQVGPDGVTVLTYVPDRTGS